MQVLATILVASGSLVGQVNDCYRIMSASLPWAEASRSVLSFGLRTIMVAATIGLSAVGRVDEAGQIAQELYDRALAEDDEWLRPRGASALGVVALMRGALDLLESLLIGLRSVHGRVTEEAGNFLSKFSRVSALSRGSNWPLCRRSPG